MAPRVIHPLCYLELEAFCKLDPAFLRAVLQALGSGLETPYDIREYTDEMMLNALHGWFEHCWDSELTNMPDIPAEHDAAFFGVTFWNTA